jgi:ABC-type sugar transport system substrate-binding protein
LEKNLHCESVPKFYNEDVYRQWRFLRLINCLRRMKMKMRKHVSWILIAVLLMLMMMAAGCSSTAPAAEEEAQTSEAGPARTFAIVYPIVHPFFEPVSDAAQEYADSIGATLLTYAPDKPDSRPTGRNS